MRERGEETGVPIWEAAQAGPLTAPPRTTRQVGKSKAGVKHRTNCSHLNGTWAVRDLLMGVAYNFKIYLKVPNAYLTKEADVHRWASGQ